MLFGGDETAVGGAEDFEAGVIEETAAGGGVDVADLVAEGVGEGELDAGETALWFEDAVIEPCGVFPGADVGVGEFDPVVFEGDAAVGGRDDPVRAEDAVVGVAWG